MCKKLLKHLYIVDKVRYNTESHIACFLYRPAGKNAPYQKNVEKQAGGRTMTYNKKKYHNRSKRSRVEIT